jgi:hypothetical protein
MNIMSPRPSITKNVGSLEPRHRPRMILNSYSGKRSLRTSDKKLNLPRDSSWRCDAMRK